ncbi:hypothetical protein PENSPDRAFT_642797 [Peniophora sp. CONT]|nr:hypothetical protein PENSPDRAFT_642797 [Peniophora sp. CONT]
MSLTDDDALAALPANFVDTLGELSTNEELVDWINTSLAPGTDDLGAMDRLVARLVASLDVASEDTSLQLEHLIDDISRSASRLHYDLHFMRDGALSLQSSLNDLTLRANKSSAPETDQALDKLHTLDITKRNMEAARAVLREAESWSTLESEVASLLSEHAYDRAAEKLAEAHRSMAVFANTPEFEGRRTLMVSLQNQLEAALSSALIGAITQQDAAQCQAYYAIFERIQRDAEFRTYYYGARRAGLVAVWTDAHLADTGESTPIQTTSTPAIPFSAFLTTFFSSFLSTLNAERTSVSAIFPDPQSTLSTFITSTLSALQPSFAQRLNSLNSNLGPMALPEIIASFKATETFAVAADKVLERTLQSSAFSPSQDGDLPSQMTDRERKLHRRRSSRMSVSRRMSLSGGTGFNLRPGVLAGSGLEWDTELFEPFLEVQAEYGALETRFLLALLAAEPAPQDVDHARALRERTGVALSLAEESLGRMLALTHGYGAHRLLGALDEFLASFVSSSQRTFSSSTIPTPGQAFGGAPADMDYSLEDWAHIQARLHLLDALRNTLERLASFEGRFRAVLQQIAAQLKSADGGLPYVPSTTRGALVLLAQSELNSLELQTLLQDAGTEEQSRPGSQELLRRRSSTGTPTVDKPLLESTRGAVAAYTGATQQALQDAMLAPLRTHLASYASLPVWSSTPVERPGRNAAPVPTFSLSPSESMQAVAEGLLGLPRLFEVYADDGSLAFSLHTLPHVDEALLASFEDAPPPEAAAHPAHHRRQSVALARPSISGVGMLTTAPVLSAEAIESVWLSALGRTLLSQLTSTILPRIRTLTPSGAAQLASDLGYLSTIVGALNAESEDLVQWRECVGLSDEEGRKLVREGGMGEGREVLGNVARMRGWATSQY